MRKTVLLLAAAALLGAGCLSKEDKDALRVLRDKDAVAGVINGLFVATDQKDWPRVKNCFADEVLFDMSSMGAGAPAPIASQTIVDGWTTGLAAIPVVHHQSGNLMIDIDGDQAAAFCYGTAFHHLPGKPGKSTRVFIGSYDFHLAKSGGAWRIDRFKFNLKFIEGNKDLGNP